jgi:O-antigen/teichoic acid export membrane protein
VPLLSAAPVPLGSTTATGRTVAQRTVRFGAASFATSLSIQLFNVCSGVMLARMLGPVGRGELAAIVLWPALLSGIGSMGIYEATVFFTSKNEHDPRVISASSILSAILMSILAVGLGLGVVPIVLRHYGGLVVVTCLLYLAWIPLNLLTYAVVGVLVGRLNAAAFNWSRAINPIVTVIGLGSLILAGHRTIRAVAALYLFAALVSLGSAAVPLARLGLIGTRPDWRLARDILTYGFKAHVGNVAGLANDRADQAIVSIFLAPVYLGYYVVAVTVGSVVSLVGSSMALAILPSVAGAGGDLERKRAFALAARVTAWGSLIGWLALVPLAPFVIHLFFGTRFMPALMSAEVLAVAAFAYSLSRVLSAGLMGLRRPWAASTGQVVGLTVTVVGLFILVPPLGVLGAAIATLLAYFSTLFYFLWTCRMIGINPKGLIAINRSELKLAADWLRRKRFATDPAR